jgi:hypothetical protein
MDAGEEYWVQFDAWFKRKAPEQKISYAAQNPEPKGWSGFYARKGVV